LGVTGERDELAATSAVLAKRLKACTDKPVVMGFGVSTVEHTRAMAAVADGVVVASRLMRILLDGGTVSDVGAYVSALRAGLDAADRGSIPDH
jgi:tryptophan synthase alpha chain